jgi:hypothetical protein
MLIHIVCWKYNPQTDAETRRDHIEQLRMLPSMISGIERFEVGADILHLDRSFDTGLVAEFAGRDELDAYTAHPEHQRVAALGREISEKTVSVDFMRGE